MACTPCENRRRMLADAGKRAGVKGVLKALPAVVRDTIKNPPDIRKKRNG